MLASGALLSCLSRLKRSGLAEVKWTYRGVALDLIGSGPWWANEGVS